MAGDGRIAAGAVRAAEAALVISACAAAKPGAARREHAAFDEGVGLAAAAVVPVAEVAWTACHRGHVAAGIRRGQRTLLVSTQASAGVVAVLVDDQVAEEGAAAALPTAPCVAHWPWLGAERSC